MRRLILIFFVFLVLGTGLALVFRDNSGYVLVAFAGWQIETSLLFAAVVVLVALWLLLTLWRLVVAGALLPRNTRRWHQQRRAAKARRSLYAGLLKYAEARWDRAEREIRRMAEKHEAPGINYLLAAKAAQHQGHVQDRDRYLEQAAAGAGTSELAVLLTQAELQMQHNQGTEALATFARLFEIESEHPYMLALYGEQCARLNDYARLRMLAPDLYKYSSLDAKRVDGWVSAAWEDKFRQAGDDIDALNEAWKNVPKQIRQRPDVVAAYARCLHAAGAEEQTVKVIRDVLRRDWNASLALLFADVKAKDDTAQLKDAERWLKLHGEEPELLLVAGRLCLRNQLWGRARSYFEASLRNQPRPDALLELGRLFEEIDQPEEARKAYRQGLERQAQQQLSQQKHLPQKPAQQDRINAGAA